MALAETGPAAGANRASRPWLLFGVLVALVMCALLAPLLAPHDPTKIHVTDAGAPPFASSTYTLGTDGLGRDVASRLIYGARVSILIGLGGLGAAGLIGTVVGLVSGYFGGKVDILIMRVVDMFLAFPTILAALVLAVLLGTSVRTIIVAIVVTMWPKFARMIRGDALAVRNRDFVALARVSGVSVPKILVRHLVPNVLNTLMVVASVLLGQVILLESTLSFLGLGLPPGTPSWGIMIAEGRTVLLDHWWISVFPGVAITVVVTIMNLLGDWLRDRLDPTLQML